MKDGMFTEWFIESVIDDVVEKIPSIKSVLPFGFVRYSKDEIDSIYIVVTYSDDHEGFVKYYVDGIDFKLDSFYYVLNNREELRFSLDGKLICQYLHFESNGVIDVIKMVDDKIIGEYEIKDNDVRELPDRFEHLTLSGIINKESSKFKCFDNEDRTYLAIVKN